MPPGSICDDPKVSVLKVQAMEEMEKLLEAARNQGKFDSEGRFKVTFSQYARSMAEGFCKAYPGLYALKFYQALHAFRASTIAIESKADYLKIEALVPTPRPLHSLLEAAWLFPQKVPSRHPLAPLLQGIWACLREAGSLHVETREQGESHRWHLSMEGVDKEMMGATQEREEKEALLAIEVRRRVAPLVDEARILRQRCGYSSLPSTLNAVSLGGHQWLEERATQRADWYERYAEYGDRVFNCYLGSDRSVAPLRLSPQGELGTEILALALPLDLVGPGRFTPVFQGITLEPLEVELGLPGAVAVASCVDYELRTDIFGMRVVEDYRLEKLVTEIESALSKEFKRIPRRISEFRARPPGRKYAGKAFGVGAAMCGLGFLTVSPLVFAMGAPAAGLGFLLKYGEVPHATSTFQSLLRLKLDHVAVSRNLWSKR